MGCKTGQCKTSTPEDIFIVTPSLGGLQTKAEVASCPHEVRLAPLDTNLVFYCLMEKLARNSIFAPSYNSVRFKRKLPIVDCRSLLHEIFSKTN